MRYLISGSSTYGLDNHSDDLMLRVLCWAIRIQDSAAEISLVARHAPENSASSLVDRVVQNLEYESRAASSGKRFRGLDLNTDATILQALVEEIASADVCILGGAPLLDTTFAPFRGPLHHALNFAVACVLAQKPLLVYGVHLGRPLSSGGAIRAARTLIQAADFVLTRDERAAQALRRMRPDGDWLTSSFDAGWALGATLPASKDPKRQEEKSKPFDKVCLTIRVPYWRMSGDLEVKRYLRDVTEFLGAVLDGNEDLSFIPHCTYDVDDFWEDDRPGHQFLARALRERGHVGNQEVLTRVPSVDDWLETVNESSLVISNRRHAGICAASRSIPFFLFGERLHVGSVYEDLGWEEGLASFVEYDQLSSVALIDSFQSTVGLVAARTCEEATHDRVCSLQARVIEDLSLTLARLVKGRV